jgi:hypothetical protein
MIDLSGSVDIGATTATLRSIMDLVLGEESDSLDSLTDDAQADFVVPLGMAAKMLSVGEYSAMELISAACTVRFSSEAHMSEFPPELVQMLTRLPR